MQSVSDHVTSLTVHSLAVSRSAYRLIGHKQKCGATVLLLVSEDPHQPVLDVSRFPWYVQGQTKLFVCCWKLRGVEREQGGERQADALSKCWLPPSLPPSLDRHWCFHGHRSRQSEKATGAVTWLLALLLLKKNRQSSHFRACARWTKRNAPP